MIDTQRSRLPSSTRSGRRRGAIFFAVAALVAAMVPATAWASHYEASLEGSFFEIDNDANFVQTATGFQDWNTVAESRNGDKPTGRDDDSYQGGVKEDTACPGEVTGSIPNNKSDLKFFGIYEEPGDPGFLHLFWTRVSDPSGTTLMDFEFNQSTTKCAQGPNVQRTLNDLLIEYSIDQGGARASITIRKWTGSAWGPAVPLSPTEATGTINSSSISAAQSDGTSTSTLQARTFGEASIDLDVIFDPDKCTSFGSAMLKSRSSDSFTSQLKDFIAPLPIDLTNCGKVVIHKETDPDGATASFGYTKSFSTDPTTSSTFSLQDGGTQTFSNVLFGTGYTVTEDDLPAGWDFDSLDCSASVGVTPSVTGATVTFDIDDEDDVLECTYHNKARARLTVVKETTDGTGSFDYTSATLSPASFTLTTTAAGAAGRDSEVFSSLTPGTYDVAETVPDNWNLTSATCDNGDAPGSVTLGAGDDVTCTFVNERERGAILVTKTRKHAADGPGEHPHAGVEFTVSGGSLAEPEVVTTGPDGTACIDGLLDGGYTVTETVPPGYASDDASKDVEVARESTCGDGNEAGVGFHNTPLTDVTVSVDSQVDGGTASTISCVDANGDVVDEDLTNAPGDVSLTVPDLEPTAPAKTLVCTIVVDP